MRLIVDLNYCKHCKKKSPDRIVQIRPERGRGVGVSFCEPETTEAEKGANRSSKAKVMAEDFSEAFLGPYLM